MRDDRLAARAAKGDRGAFAELYRRHHQRLYRYCLSLVGNPEDAADALQTAMAKALSALERGEKVKGVRPWLFRIGHNTAIDTIRARRPRAPVEEIEEIEASALTVPSAASEAQRREELAEVVADIRGLSERQGSALVMRELSELSYAEISAALSTSPLAARQLVHQARSLLHDNREGRGMDCEKVRQELGDSNGKRPRDRRMRAHLAACQGCTAFGQAIRTRRSALAAFAPPLAPAAASEILGRLLESGTAGGAAAGGVSAGIAKVAGASGVAKVAGAAAVGTAAVAAVGGAVVAGGALLGADEVTSRLRPPAGAEALLRPELPALRPMPAPLRRSGDKSRGGERSAAEGASRDGAREPASSKTDSGPADGSAKRPGPSGPSGNGLAPVDLGGDDTPVDLRIVDRPGRDDLETFERTVSTVKAPDLPNVGVDVPGGSVPGGSPRSGVELPEVEIPEVEVPTGGSSPSGSGGSDAEVPQVDVPEVSVDVPSSGSSPSQGSGASSSMPGL